MASTILDLPQPLGPTMPVTPSCPKVVTVLSQKDLKPSISILRSFSKLGPVRSASWVAVARHRRRRHFPFPQVEDFVRQTNRQDPDQGTQPPGADRRRTSPNVAQRECRVNPRGAGSACGKPPRLGHLPGAERRV